MPICPNCGYEYRVGKTLCPDCNEKMVDSPTDDNPLPEKKAYRQAKGDLRLLYTTPDSIYAELLKATLDSEGIPCLMKRSAGIYGHFTAIMPDVHSMYKIWVPENLYEDSLEIKRQIMGDD